MSSTSPRPRRTCILELQLRRLTKFSRIPSSRANVTICGGRSGNSDHPSPTKTVAVSGRRWPPDPWHSAAHRASGGRPVRRRRRHPARVGGDPAGVLLSSTGMLARTGSRMPCRRQPARQARRDRRCRAHRAQRVRGGHLDRSHMVWFGARLPTLLPPLGARRTQRWCPQSRHTSTLSGGEGGPHLVSLDPAGAGLTSAQRLASSNG